MRHSRAYIVSMALAATCLTQAASAQEDSAGLTDIVVTARKSKENLQTVPLAITALSSDTLENANARQIRDIALLTPGLNISGDGAEKGQQPSIRGLSFTGDGNAEGNVAVLLDGIYMSNSSALSVGLMDFERVEVVKGPQSALYGANAFAGAINYVPKAPPKEFEGKVQARLGSYLTRSFMGSVGGPLVKDILTVRLAAIYDHNGGSYRDQVNRKTLGGFEKQDVSLQFRLTPDSVSTYDLGLYYGLDTFGPSMQANFAANCAGAQFCGEVPDGKNVEFMASNIVPTDATGNRRIVKHARFKAAYDLDAVDINANFGFFDVRQRSFAELFGLRDGQSFPLALASSPTVPTGGTVNLPGFFGGSTNNKDYSAELRVASKQNQPFRWSIGGYFFKTDQEVTVDVGFNRDPIPAGQTIICPTTNTFACQWLTPGGNRYSRPGLTFSHNRQASVFGGIAYDVFEALTLSAEVRYTDELKKTNIIYSVTAPTVVGPDGVAGDPDGNNGQRARFKYWNPRFSANLKLTPDNMLYATVAKGTKSGGFNARATRADELSFAPENNWTYEIGLKNTFFDRKVRLNIAAFYVDWTDLQILVPSANLSNPAPVTKNYGGVRASGGEIELAAQVARGVVVNGGIAYTNPKFTNGTYDFSAANVNACRLIASCAPRVQTGVVPSTGGAATTAINLDGTLRQLVSKWQYVAGISVDRPLTDDWNWFLNANYKYESRQFTNLDDFRTVGPRNTVGAQLGVKREDVRFTVWAQNLLNDLTAYGNTAGQSVSRYNGSAAVPRAFYPDQRRIGVTLDYSF